MENAVLSDNMKRVADRMRKQIARADTMILAAKAGARAEGFVLGLETAGSLTPRDAQNLYIVFEAAVEERLKSLTVI